MKKHKSKISDELLNKIIADVLESEMQTKVPSVDEKKLQELLDMFDKQKQP